MLIRIRLEFFVALILGILGIGSLLAAWFSRAILVFRLDEYAGGEHNDIAESAFILEPAQVGLLVIGLALSISAVTALIVGIARSAPRPTTRPE